MLSSFQPPCISHQLLLTHICEDLRSYKPLPDKQLLFHLLVCAFPCSSLPPTEPRVLFLSFLLIHSEPKMCDADNCAPFTSLLKASFPEKTHQISWNEMFSLSHCDKEQEWGDWWKPAVTALSEKYSRSFRLVLKQRKRFWSRVHMKYFCFSIAKGISSFQTHPSSHRTCTWGKAKKKFHLPELHIRKFSSIPIYSPENPNKNRLFNFPLFHQPL